MSNEILEKVEALTQEVNVLKAEREKHSLPGFADKAMSTLVKPHTERLRAMAIALEAAGVGLHPHEGHVRLLKEMAEQMEMEAAEGHLTQRYAASALPGLARDEKILTHLAALQASLESLSGEVHTLKMEKRLQAQGPERKTIALPTSLRNLLAKSGVKEEGGETLDMDKLNAIFDAAKTPTEQRIAAKLNLRQAGLLT